MAIEGQGEGKEISLSSIFSLFPFVGDRGATYGGLSGELVLGEEDGGNLTILGEDLAELGLLVVTGQVLDENVGPLGISGRNAGLAGDVLADPDLLVVPRGLVETSDGLGGGIRGLEVDKAEALGVSLVVGHNLAREDVAVVGEGVVELLGVVGSGQVLDEQVSDTRATDRGITLRPHQADGAVQDLHVGLGLHGLLGCI